MIANRVAYGNTLIEMAKTDEKIVVLDADVGKSTGILDFKKVFPERYIDVGIAEANMTCMAAGMASCGMIPFVTTFAVFTSMRTIEQIRNSICYPNFNVKLAGTHAGLETGADGGTHQATEDIAIMRSIANMTILAPSTPIATNKITKVMTYTYGPMYLRLGKEVAPEFYTDDDDFPIGGSKELACGNYATIMAVGNTVPIALEAAKELKAEGIDVRVLDMYSLKPIDKGAIIKAAKETNAIITIEDHSIIGGLGGAVCEVVCDEHPTKVIRIGLNDTFGRSGDMDGLFKLFGITKERIIEVVKGL